MTISKRVGQGAAARTIALTNMDLWKEHAGPKHVDRQWQDLASAKEAARAWVGALPAMPSEIEAVLATHAAFGTVEEWTAEPEVKLPFDRLGEARNSDLLVRARDARGAFLIAVEAKAAESFGSTIAATRRAAEVRLAASKDKARPSRGLERIDALCETYLGATVVQDATIGTLYYQLLTASAGAIQVAVSERTDRIVLLIQEFVSGRTPPKTRTRNANALDLFVDRLTRGAVRTIPMGRFVAIPVPVGVTSSRSPALFFAKVERSLKA